MAMPVGGSDPTRTSRVRAALTATVLVIGGLAMPALAGSAAAAPGAAQAVDDGGRGTRHRDVIANLWE